MLHIEKQARRFAKDESGPFDLQSTTISLIVIAVLVGIVAAAIFLVAPFARDTSARMSLSSVGQAQTQYMAMGSTAQSSYASKGELIDDNRLPESQKDDAVTQAVGDRDQFAAVRRSGTGKFYIISSANTEPHEAVYNGNQKAGSIDEALSLAVSEANQPLARINQDIAANRADSSARAQWVDGWLTSTSSAASSTAAGASPTVPTDSPANFLNPAP